MGGTLSSSMVSQIESEFDRVLGIKNRYLQAPKEYLTIDEARQHLTSPMEQYPLNFMKLPILFLLDQDLDGKFTREDLVKFCNKIATVTNEKVVEQDFSDEITSYAIMYMWHIVTVDLDGFIRWLVRALVLDHRVEIPRYPDVVYVSVDVVSVLYDVLDVPTLFEGLNVQQLIDLMQHVGEQEGLMNLSDQQLDNVVPARVIRIFSQSFVDGFERMMSRLGFIHEHYFAPTDRRLFDQRLGFDHNFTASDRRLLEQRMEQPMYEIKSPTSETTGALDSDTTDFDDESDFED